MPDSATSTGGSEDGRQNSLLRAITVRFGPIPSDLATAVGAVTDAGELKRLWETALTAKSLDAFRAAIHE